MLFDFNSQKVFQAVDYSSIASVISQAPIVHNGPIAKIFITLSVPFALALQHIH